MKKFKKIALLVATAAMVLGATMSAFAASEEETLNVGSKGYVNCYVYAGSGYVEADTSTYANYTTTILSYASVDLTVYYGETIVYVDGSDSDSENAVDTSTYAYAAVSTSAVVYDKISGNSTHSGTIDGTSVGCSLYAEN